MDWQQKVTRSAVFGDVVGRDGDFSLFQEWPAAVVAGSATERY